MAKKSIIIVTGDGKILEEFRSCFEPEFTIFMASDFFGVDQLCRKKFPSAIFVDSRHEANFFTDKAYKISVPVFVFRDRTEIQRAAKELPMLLEDPSSGKIFQINHSFSSQNQDFPACLSDFCGKSSAIVEFKRKIIRAAPSGFPVLFTGESGCGKSVAAKALHDLSGLKNNIFFKVNISAVPPSLAESELFGTEKGAFTDSVRREGYFKGADGGTLFLDEIGDASLEIQKKLLHAIETGEFRKVGSDKVEHSHIRFVFATNANLQDKIKNGEFRCDLFYRIAKIIIEVPPLRQRKSDIPDLCMNFFEKNGLIKTIHDNAFRKLQDYSWPGNIRELENCLERACYNSGDSRIIVPEHIEFF